VQADLVVRAALEPPSRRRHFPVSLAGSPTKPLTRAVGRWLRRINIKAVEKIELMKNVLTFLLVIALVGCNKPAEVLRIENIPSRVTVFLWDGPEPDKSTQLEILHRDSLIYRQIFFYPDDSPTGAGIGFWLIEPTDLSEYQSIEFKLIFETEIKTCDFYIADKFGKHQSVHCKEPFSSNNVGVKTKMESDDTQLTTIPLSGNFDNVDLKSVKSIYLVLYPDLPKPLMGREAMTYGLSDIQFNK
jgi:hypothetical protein